MNYLVRAWDKWDKRMVWQYWGSFRWWYDSEKGGKACFRRNDESKLRLSEPMFYTGLKDKNGKRIFRGDIVRWTLNKSQSFIGDIRYTITRVGSGFTMHLVGYSDYHGIYTNSIEIIGNRYENLELLEKL